MIKPWKILQTRQTFKDRFLGVRTDRCAREDGHVIDTYHVVELSSWVTVFPITDAGNIVLIREYRHGAGIILTGPPGGISDAGETDWEAVGLRELAEETGYEARQLVKIGSCYPNPANQDNELHFFLALGCTPTARQALDPNEEIEVLEMPYADFLAYEELDEQHGLHAAGLYYLERYFTKFPENRPKSM